MNPKMTIRLTNYVLILIIFCLSHIRCSDGTGVPVLIWRTEGQILIPSDLNSKPTITRIDSNVLRDDYLNKNQTIIAFIQNDLSIEQFSSEDKNQFKTLSHIISDQSLEPILLTDVLDPNEALKDFSIQELNNLNINNGNKIVINLPKNSLVENDELIGQLLAKIRQNVSINTLYLLTGRHNNQYNEDYETNDQIVVNNRFRRHILADDSKKSRKNEDMNRLININNCLFFFMRSLAVNYYTKSSSNSSLILSFDSLRNKPSLGKSICWTNNGEEPAILDLTYQKINTKLQLKLIIGRNDRFNFWEIRKGAAILTDSNAQPIIYELNVENINAENQFSYSCSKLTILSKVGDKPNKNGLTPISLVFNGFQLQPFENPKNKNLDKKSKYYVFADSFDCQPWITLGLWMGLIVLILFTTILLIGVYILSKVNTPDRFENPKGKPLIITNADE